MAKYVFSEMTREHTRLEVIENHKRMLELDAQRKQVLAEYHRLEDEVRKLNKSIEDACEVMGIDWEFDTEDGKQTKKVFFLKEDTSD